MLSTIKKSDTRIYDQWRTAENTFLKGDLAGALFLLKKLAKEGCELAFLEIGNIYELGGGGVEKNLKKAIAWYERSISEIHENPAAHLALGRLYLQSSETCDFAKASHHFLIAKDSEMGALFGLGMLFERGQGVPKSNEKALVYYREAANLGHITALARISSLSREGGGVKRVCNWIKTRHLMAKLIKADPTIKTKHHHRLGISTSLNVGYDG